MKVEDERCEDGPMRHRETNKTERSVFFVFLKQQKKKKKKKKKRSAFELSLSLCQQKKAVPLPLPRCVATQNDDQNNSKPFISLTLARKNYK
jgi:hypothetical protein